MPELGRCRSCNALVRFVPTDKTGKLMPIDPDPVARGLAGIAGPAAVGNVVIRGGRAHVLCKGETWDEDLFVPHFASCPAGRQWGRQVRRATDRAIARVHEDLED